MVSRLAVVQRQKRHRNDLQFATDPQKTTGAQKSEAHFARAPIDEKVLNPAKFLAVLVFHRQTGDTAQRMSPKLVIKRSRARLRKGGLKQNANRANVPATSAVRDTLMIQYPVTNPAMQ
jgi:hypothetical protein